MSLITFQTSIPHRNCTYLELCPTRESWYMKQSTTSKNNFVVWKFNAKDMNEFQQALSRTEEVRKENVLWTDFWSLTMLRSIFFWSCLRLWKLRQSNIVLLQQTKVQIEVFIQKYGLIHTRGLPWLYLSSLHIPQGVWTYISHGED